MGGMCEARRKQKTVLCIDGLDNVPFGEWEKIPRLQAKTFV